MKDTFEETIAKFLVPMDEFEPPATDSTYFLRKDGSFVFAEGYCHPPGALWGMIIKYPHPEGHINVFGRSYSWTHREYVDGELRIVPPARQVENQFRVAPELRAVQREKPPFAAHLVKFPLSDFRGVFDNRRALRRLRRDYDWIDRAVRETCGLLKVDDRTPGVSGSLSYGLIEDDIDIVFFGTPEENAATIARIQAYKKEHPEAKVVELGKEWPLRFHYAGTLICPFFKYSRPADIPLLECGMKTREKGLRFRATVAEDLHSFYLPAVVELTGLTDEEGAEEGEIELIVYDGALRGELRRGDRIGLSADRVVLTTPRKGSRNALLVTDMDQVRRD